MTTPAQTQPPPQTTAVAKKTPEQLLRNLLAGDSFRKQVSLALPKHLTPDRFVRLAISAVGRVPKLANCTQASVTKCLMQLSELGLEPDGRRAHLIPFEDRKRKVTECTLIIDYKGLAELAQRGGTISNIHADVVCENDEFEYDRGELKCHKVNFRKPRGEPYAAYALIRFKDGSEKCEVMGKDEIYAVREKSSGYRAYVAKYVYTNPWADPQSEPEMWKKTVFRRASKWLVLSPEIRDQLDKVEKHDERLPASATDALNLPSIDVESEPVPALSEGATEPEPPDDGTKPQPPEPTEQATPQQRLEKLCTDAEIPFDIAQKWLVQSGNAKDAESLTSWADLDDATATRLLRAPGSLMREIKKLMS